MRLRHFILLLGMHVCFFQQLQAQSSGPKLASVTLPSPNVQAMQKYGDIPVSPYTGVPNISIPLYTVKFRDVTVPISLSYHASGIKVAEEASQVGLGWTLNAGGAISRTITGGDDFQDPIYFNSSGNTIPDFADGLQPKEFISFNGVLPMIDLNTHSTYDYALYPLLDASPGFDFQPDQYYYNIPGSSGKFVVKRNRQAVLENQEKIQITMTAIDGTAWQIKGLDGSIYDFTKYETYTDNVGTNQNHMSAWYLTKITSPTGNMVDFHYTVSSQQVQSIGGYSEQVDVADLYVPVRGVAITGSNIPDQKGQSVPKIYSKVTLDYIDFPTGQLKFNFSTDPNSRIDLLGDVRLDSLSIFAKDKSGTLSTAPVKTIALGYSFFNYGDNDDDYNAGDANNSQRLKLTQVQEIGYYHGVKTPSSPYTFSYYEGSAYTDHLPSKASFARDHWGYYNGKTGNTSLIPAKLPLSSPDYITAALGIDGPQREPDPACLNAFSLKSIQYPTGGSTEFQYEANDFDEQLSKVNDHTYFNKVYSITTPTIFKLFNNYSSVDTLHLEDEYIYDANQANGIGYVSLNAHFRFSSSDCGRIFNSNYIKFEIFDSTGTGSSIVSKDLHDISSCSGGATTGCLICSGYVFTYLTTLMLAPAKYVIKITADYGSGLQDMGLDFTYNAQQSSIPPPGSIVTTMYSYAGGIRIKEIIDHDGISASNDKKTKYIYHYAADKNNDGTPENYSYGRRMSRPQYNSFLITHENDQLDFGGPMGGTAFWSQHLMRSSDSNIPLNGSAKGAVVGYDQVTVLHGENGENGKTVYQYYNQPDMVSDFPNYGGLPDRPPYASNITDPLNGSLLQQVDYANVNGSFMKLKTVANNYHVLTSYLKNVIGVESRPPAYNYVFNGVNTGQDLRPATSNFLYCYYSIKSGFPYLSSSDEKVYNQGDTTQYFETVSNYYYDNTAHLQPTRVVVNNSKNEIITTTTKYPLDYPTPGATGLDAFSQGIKYLQDNNVVVAPVEKYVTKINQDGTNARTVGGVLTSYSNTDPVPSLIYQSMLASPATTFIISDLNSGHNALQKDPSYEQFISFDSYDANGNVLQQHKMNDVNHAYIWDYQNSLPVAEAVNAAQSKIAYTSFEFDGAGNWTIGSSLRDATKSFNGTQSFNLANGIIAKAYSTGDTSIVSYWSTDGANSYTVSGTIGTALKGKTVSVNGTNWTYYEHIVTGVTPTLSVSGTGNIDELRLYPIHAQMITYTFDPMIGMTSQCDVNNHASYYEYDGLGRLKDIKDQDGNILKTFEYHYKQ